MKRKRNLTIGCLCVLILGLFSGYSEADGVTANGDPIGEYEPPDISYINILTSDDLEIEDIANYYEYYE